ncbi:Fanconi anemia group A protein isoform X2 [Ambystoma mexicanum]|uniref:Fanconi anemia group A protein isoform X2 n=1 Tax=Ambystoma mexicanum TaxID=8296 RepID=UPI0037E81CBF
MSEVIVMSPSGQQKALSELLAGRIGKRKAVGVCDTQRLQESAVHLISSHQDLSDLLTEMGSPTYKKPFSSSVSSDQRSFKSPAALPGPFVGYVLQGQASHLGVPVGILSARVAAAQIGQICQSPVDCIPSALLNPDQRERLLSLLCTIKDLLMQSSFCRSVFCQEIWKLHSPPVLEAAWHLHKEVVDLEALLESSPDPKMAEEWLCSGLSLLCQQMDGPPQDPDIPRLILTDILITLIQHGFQRTLNLGKRTEEHKTPQVSRAVLDHMLSWFLNAITEEKQIPCKKLKVAEHWLCAFEGPAHKSSVPLESREQFFNHTLTQVLTFRPLLTVSDAVRMQGDWSFAKACPLLTNLYRRLFVMFSMERLISHLQQVLESQEVNWQHVLTCVSTLVICQTDAQPLIKGLLTQLLTKAFENYELESVITAFLIVRQAALEGPAAFMSYTEWFKVSFGNTTGYHSGSKKSLVFLLKFLSDLVPFEAPQYLKVHIIYPPFLPTKYRPVLLEYISLAKTRLADLKVSIEDMGLYEDLSSVADSSQKQPQFQALQDVEKAIQIFENTGKIPASVIEASIFRRPYYNSRFLPALLAPRPLPIFPDLRMQLIDSLKRSDKIPANVYSGYLQACLQEKQRLIQDPKLWNALPLDIVMIHVHSGQDWRLPWRLSQHFLRAVSECETRTTTTRPARQGEPMETDLSEEPVKHLEAALNDLGLLITDCSRSAAIPAQIALISERLSVLVCSSDIKVAALDLPIQLTFSGTKMDHQDHVVADLLLKSFCKNVMAACSWYPPDRQGVWPSLFVKMLCGHRQVLTAVLRRFVQLICHQGCLLNNAHTLGLAVFAVHLNESKYLLPPLDTTVPSSRDASENANSLSKFWNHLLECTTGESLSFCLRFCTAVVSYTLCKFPLLSQDDVSSYIPPVLIKKIRHALPRECLEARGVASEEEVHGVEASWTLLSNPSMNWKRASLCLWKQHFFSEILRLEIFQFSFRDWLQSEMQIETYKDVLSEAERQDYHCWAVYQCYLPSPTADGGCDGDLEGACTIVVNALVDFWNRFELNSGSSFSGSVFPFHNRTGSADILCRLQEMIYDMELARKMASVQQGCLRPRDHQGHFLFNLFQERLKATGDGRTTGDQLARHQELLMLSRILVALPPSVLMSVRHERKHELVDCSDFFHFVDTELKNICSRGYTLPYNITEHFFRGLLSAILGCEEPAQVVDSALLVCQDECPILLTSLALWWPRLEPVLCCQWNRLFRIPLPQELQRLKEWQDTISQGQYHGDSCFSQPWLSTWERPSFLSTGDAFLPSDVTWVYVAFVYFTVQRRADRGKIGEDLRKLLPDAHELLVPLLFFSVMDVISSRSASKNFKEDTEFRKCLDVCLEILSLLEERGVPWLLLFHPSAKELESHRTLHRSSSEHHLKMLPIAFYSIVPYVQQSLLTREENFLDTAVMMFAGLVHLFLDGDDPGIEQIDSMELIVRSRQYLLSSIPQCPKRSHLQINQLLDACGDFDPEVRAALRNTSMPSPDQTLYDEPILF